jgi:hypothetical protein
MDIMVVKAIGTLSFSFLFYLYRISITWSINSIGESLFIPALGGIICSTYESCVGSRVRFYIIPNDIIWYIL